MVLLLLWFRVTSLVCCLITPKSQNLISDSCLIQFSLNMINSGKLSVIKSGKLSVINSGKLSVINSGKLSDPLWGLTLVRFWCLSLEKSPLWIKRTVYINFWIYSKCPSVNVFKVWPCHWRRHRETFTSLFMNTINSTSKCSLHSMMQWNLSTHKISW